MYLDGRILTVSKGRYPAYRPTDPNGITSFVPFDHAASFQYHQPPLQHEPHRQPERLRLVGEQRGVAL